MHAHGIRGRPAAVLLAAVALLSSACGGGGGGTKSERLIGVWTGTYTETGSETGATPFQLLLFPTGHAIVREGDGLADESDGSWVMDGGQLSVHYAFKGGAPTFTYVGVPSGGALTGTWGFGASASGGGDFAVELERAPGNGIWKLEFAPGSVDVVLLAGGALKVFQSGVEIPMTGSSWSVTGTILTFDLIGSGGSSVWSFQGTIDGSGDAASGAVTLNSVAAGTFTATRYTEPTPAPAP